MNHKRYEIWLLTHPKGGLNPQIWRENRESCDAQTPFQHAIGIRYKREGAFLYPQTKIEFLTFGKSGAPKKTSELFADVFHKGRHSRNLTRYHHGTSQILGRVTGYAMFCSRKLKKRSVSKVGAVYSGSIWVHKKYDY